MDAEWKTIIAQALDFRPIAMTAFAICCMVVLCNTPAILPERVKEIKSEGAQQ